ncbi:MAG: agglutinin biogenesis protein MshI [Gallionella sp.]|nr:agglutinin biogenesis protein MshI [Gallionella sp.]MDD4960112.1 agglutinin biogenesis protein MshI [Gallionella sp.]
MIKLSSLFPLLFRSKPRDAGWLAVRIAAHGVYLARVELSSMPCVLRCEYHEMRDITSASLEKMKRETKLGDPLFSTILAVGDYQLLMVDAPNVPAEELKTAVRWKIKDSLNCLVNDATIDVLQIPTNQRSLEYGQSIYAVAASNVTIQKYISLFEQAKFKLNVIDIPETAQRNISVLFEQEDRALGLLAFDDDGGLLTITAKGELYFARRVDITLGQLQDANEILRQQHRDRVRLELRRSLDYFDRQYHELPISRVIVSVAEQTELVPFLQGNMDVSIEQLDLAQVMDIHAIPELNNSEFVAHALTTLGAALREERRVL